MLRLFQAGIVAISLQLVAITTITVATGLTSRDGFFQLVSSSTDHPTDNPLLMFGAPFLTWAYLLTAIGFAFTRGRFVDATTERIRRAARAMHPTGPAIAIRILFSQCLLCAVGSAVVSLSIPPHFLVLLARNAGNADFAMLIWSAAFSLGVAGFGATAYATRNALL